jgi:MerR family regulatory protein
MRITIGVLSERSGAKVETIRYYERIGLVPVPMRTEGRHRLYGADDIKRVIFIRRSRGSASPSTTSATCLRSPNVGAVAARSGR